MSANFKRVPETQLGYEPNQVDATIALARQQFSEPTSRVIGASGLRTSQFELVKGGYEVASVDAALDRLDDAFAQNEANRLIALSGHHGARDYVANLGHTLVERASRPSAKKFRRTGWFAKGYSRRQVDAIVSLVRESVQSQDELAVSYLRQVVFSPRWGGYRENQVDAFIDRAIEFFQLSRSVL